MLTQELEFGLALASVMEMELVVVLDLGLMRIPLKE
jgi:hypothetical protein